MKCHQDKVGQRIKICLPFDGSGSSLSRLLVVAEGQMAVQKNETNAVRQVRA
jgi:hypothetical protein